MMKKLIAITFVLMCTLTVSAQTIYSSIEKYDKFDDVVWTKKIKTIISKSYSTIVVETKGQKPTEYEYLNEPLFATQTGSREDLVNLVNDIYGYESIYCLFPKGTIEKTYETIKSEIPDSLATEEMIDAKVKLKLMVLMDDMPTITFRTVSYSQYSFEYETELAWIRFKDGSRVIYRK